MSAPVPTGEVMVMGRASVAVAGFAFVGGASADPAGCVHISPAPDRYGRVLLACVEPVDPSSRGWELAAVALRVMRETFAATPGPADAALMAAFAAANAAVMAENRPLATGRWERRICVGASGIALEGRDVVVAQALPSQVILVQDRQVYPFPEVASWRGDFQPNEPLAESHPLGFAEEAAPRLYVSQAAAGDLVALCATSVGRILARDEDAVVDLYGGRLLTEDLEGTVDRLERLLAPRALGDGFAAVAAIARLPRRVAWASALPRVARTAGPRAPLGPPDPPSPVRPAHAKSTFAMEDVAADPLDAAARRPPPFEAMRERVIDLAELIGAGRHRTPVYASRERALAAPGALSVRRYRESSGLPAEWRANLPRGPGMQLPARLLAVSLVLFVALGGTGIAAVRQREREAMADAALVATDAALRSAEENNGAAMTAVAEAERALASARAAGAGAEDLAAREESLARVRDGVWNIRRLGDVERLGSLPKETSGAARLALAGQTVYVAADHLYEFDIETGTLVTLLSRGERVGDAEAGAIGHVSIDDGHVAASDGEAIFRRDRGGRWERQPLAIAEMGGLRPEAPLIAWGDAAYGISRDGDIVRFESTDEGGAATIWAGVDESPDLELLRDMAIDGRIHVLLDDGRLLTYSRGVHAGTVAPFITPALSGSSFLASAPFANAFYVVDREGSIGTNAGRIVRIDAAGEAVQLLTPEPEPAGDGSVSAMAATALATADDLIVDELTGMVLWVSDGELWRASLPVD